MLLFVAGAMASGLPWECPPVATPADAAEYRGVDLDAPIETIRALVLAYEDYPCAWEELASEDGTSLTRTCDDGAVRVESLVFDGSMGSEGSTRYEITVTVTSGETWTTLLYQARSSWIEDMWSSSSSNTQHVEWVGGVEGLPDDGEATAGETVHTSGSGTSLEATYETPSCSWEWSQSYGTEADAWQTTETVSAHGQPVVVVYGGEDHTCADAPVSHARVDGVPYGRVDPDTWEDDPTDLDRDGWAGAWDCDEADADRNTCAEDAVDDGVDQDCDGQDAHALDRDGDGWENVYGSGGDCDDDADSVHPGADDPGDGIDQDCDGADDVDSDGDGYTLDGDDGDPDCDDDDAARHPDAEDIPYDAVDQDCTGEDVSDVDHDGDPGIPAGGSDCDDEDPRVRTGAVERPCDGVDQDCDGGDSCTDTSPDTGDASGDTPQNATGCADASGGCGGRGAAWLALAVVSSSLRRSSGGSGRGRTPPAPSRVSACRRPCRPPACRSCPGWWRPR